MNNKNFAVGVFVALALAAFVGSTLWLTGKQGSQPTVNYSMFFEKDVGGLMLGGPVFYLGVAVGTVTSMEIIPGDPMRVRVDAEVLKSAPVNEGTYASLALQGITGVAVIKLNAEPGQYKPLKIGPESQHHVITVRDTGLTALLAKAPDIVAKLDSVMDKINLILGEDNREYVSAMLSDLSDVTGALAAKQETIGELPDLLKVAIEDLKNSLSQISSTVEKLEPGMSSTITNLDQASSSLVTIVERLETWTSSNDSKMNAFMGDGLGEVPALITDARETLREINKLVMDLRKNPSKLIYKPNEDAVDVEQ